MTPGFHLSIPSEEYHADRFTDDPSLSSSIAKLLLRESPRKAWFNHPRLNANYVQQQENQYDLGTAAHALFLEDDLSKVAVIDPADYPSKTGSIPEGWTNNAIREARERARAEGKTPMLKGNYAKVEAMVKAARAFVATSEVADLWNAKDAASEVTALAKDGDVWLRARFDRFSQAGRFIGDYKSTADASPDVFSRQIVRMGYHVQEAFYRRVARLLGVKAPHFVFLAQSVEEPHECSLHGCDPAMQQIADGEIELAIDLWRSCIRKKQWPSYGGRIHWAAPSTWQIAEYEARLEEVA